MTNIVSLRTESYREVIAGKSLYSQTFKLFSRYRETHDNGTYREVTIKTASRASVATLAIFHGPGP